MGSFSLRNCHRLLIAASLALAAVSPTSSASALPTASPDITTITLSTPVGSERFGEEVLVLSNGNYVVVDSRYDSGQPDVGAVYLYDGETDAVIDLIRGVAPNDQVGSGGVFEVGDSNFVIVSPLVDDFVFTDAGAVTWVDGETGVSGVNPNGTNSYIGSNNDDRIGNNGIVVLSDGDFLIVTASWDNGTTQDAGAVTWVDGNAGGAGLVGTTNSIHGTSTFDYIGRTAVALTNGHYVVGSNAWDFGATSDAGIARWASGDGSSTGPVSAANSVYGTKQNDRVGSQVTALTNGHYVIGSSNWSDGTTKTVGAVTWVDGTAEASFAVSTDNSLHGDVEFDAVGREILALTNGNYVVDSNDWRDVGAATWVDGSAASTGPVTAANSLIGSAPGDRVGDELVALPNGNYVVVSSEWDFGGIVDAGAATWGNGATGTVGVVGPANSVHGTSTGDFVGDDDLVVLSNGNFVVISEEWDGPNTTDAGAITWGSGTGGTVGALSAANSLVGTTADDFDSVDVIPLANGDYAVAAEYWDDGPIVDVGAVVRGDGASGSIGEIAKSSSLHGSTEYDAVGSHIIALADGGYVVLARRWDSPTVEDAGAAAYVEAESPVTGPVTESNSLTGSIADDHVGDAAVALPDGSYVVLSRSWNSPSDMDAGAMTFGVGGAGVAGTINSTNSAIGIPPGQLTGAAPLYTADDGVVVQSDQNQVLVMKVDRAPRFTTQQADITVDPPAGTTSAVVTYATPTAVDTKQNVTVACDPPSGSEFPRGVTVVTCIATDTSGLTAEQTFTITVTGPPIISLDPARVLETRPGEVTIDGVAQGSGPITGDSEIEIPLAGRAGVPSDADAVVLNATAINPAGRGFVTLHSCGTRPLASSLNYPAAGAVVGNEVIAKLSPAGSVCAYSFASSHLTFDVVGYVPAGSDYASLDPSRVADTRPGESTIDGVAAGGGPIDAGMELEVAIAGRGGVPASGADAAVLNITAINPSGRGFVTLHPCGTRPLSSSLNYASAGTVVGNEVIAKLSPTGAVCAYTSAASHLTFDVVGYLPSGAAYTSTDPTRFLETRPGEVTFDGQSQGAGTITGGEAIELQVAGRAGVPTTATAAVLNLTAINPAGRGFVTAYPCGTRPLASSLNYGGAGVVAGNEIVAKLSPTGSVCIFSSATTHLTADLTGHL